MGRCAACGRDNPEGFRFCGFCAAPLDAGHGDEVRKTVTVLFSDVTGSTALGELLDPMVLRDALEFFERKGAVADSLEGPSPARGPCDALIPATCDARADAAAHLNLRPC